MKHYLLFRPSFFQIAIVAILALMFAPVLLASVAFPAASAAVLGAGMFGAIGAPLFSPAGDGSEGGAGSGEKADDPTDDPKLSIGQRLTAALSSKASLQAKIGTHEARIKELETANATAEQEKADLQKKLDEANAKIATMEADAKEVEKALAAAEQESKDLQAKEQNIEKRAENKSKEKVAALGFKASDLPASSDKASHEENIEGLKAAFEGETDPAKKAEARQKLKEARAAAAA